LIINRIYLLNAVVPEDSILTWDFFIQRFETLALEAQLKAAQDGGGEHALVQGFGSLEDTTHSHLLHPDLLHSDPMSEIYQRKLTKARQSLNEAESVRSIVRSLRGSSLKHQLNLDLKLDKGENRKLTTLILCLIVAAAA
jgi:hypothetical protein